MNLSQSCNQVSSMSYNKISINQGWNKIRPFETKKDGLM